MEPPIYFKVYNDAQAAKNLRCFLADPAVAGAEEIAALALAADARNSAQRFEEQFELVCAEELYLLSLSFLDDRRPVTAMAWACVACELSLLYLKSGQPPLARWYARRAAKIALHQKETSDDGIKVIAFYGALLFRLGHYCSAARYLRRAYCQRRKLKTADARLFADIIDLLVDVYFRRNQIDKASSCQRLSRKLRHATLQQVDLGFCPAP